MVKIDLVKQDKDVYSAKTKPEIVDVPTMTYLMYDGQGSPEGNPDMQVAFDALYGVAYTIKFMPKHDDYPPGYQDFKIPPSEGLWWLKDGNDFDHAKPDDWYWTLMIRMPDFATEIIVDTAIAELSLKKHNDIYWKVRLGVLKEGMAVQMMHIGPYDAEEASIAQMNAFIETGGYHYTGKHHEIYFSDPRRTRPEKLKTILRHPVTHLVS